MSALTLFSFLFFTGLVAVISWWKTRSENLSSSSGYFLGGRSLSGIVIAGSLLLTNLSTEQLVGMNGQGFSAGLAVMGWEVTSGFTLVLMALIFLPRYLRGGIATVADFIEKRYDAGTRNLIAGLFLISLGGIFLPTVLYSGALALDRLFGVQEILGVSQTTALVIMVWAIGIVGSIYAIFGGLKAVAVSDTVNGVGLLIGGMLIPILALIKLGDGSFGEGVTTLINVHPEKLNAIGDSASPVPFGALFCGIMLINVFYWCTNQAIVQRTFGAKNLAEGQKGVLYAGFLKIFAPFILVIPGIAAFHLYPEEVLKPDFAYPVLVAKILPTYLVGFFGAVLFGAILSSFNSALNSASTLFALNLYRPIIKPDIADKDLVRVCKFFGIGLAIFSMLVAPYIANAPDGLFTFMKKFMGFFNIPTLIVILVGFFTARVSAFAAKATIALYMTLYGIFQFVFPVDMSFLYLLGILFGVCTIFMLIVGRLRPHAEAYVQETAGGVDLTPWKYAWHVSAAAVISMIAIYATFSPWGLIAPAAERSQNMWVIGTATAIASVVAWILCAKKARATV
jgi:SSS family solute:Na+ symporter